MKGKPVIIFIILNALVMGINWVHYRAHNSLLLAYRMYGGEITEEFSPGLNAVHIYAMTPDGTTTHVLRFELVSLVLSVAVCAVVLYLSLKCIGQFRRLFLTKVLMNHQQLYRARVINSRFPKGTLLDLRCGVINIHQQFR